MAPMHIRMVVIEGSCSKYHHQQGHQPLFVSSEHDEQKGPKDVELLFNTHAPKHRDDRAMGPTMLNEMEIAYEQ